MFSDLYISEINIRGVPEGLSSVYPFCLSAVKGAQKLELKKKVTFFVGENGTGKSTLLEAIAVSYGFNAEGGSRNHNFSSRPTHSQLFKYMKLIKGVRHPKDGYFLRAESYYNALTYMEELDEIPAAAPPVREAYGGILHAQSHGESFLSLVKNRLRGNGLYILDEPESALSPMRQLVLLSELKRLADEGSQFIIATHSPIIMALPGADIFLIENDRIVKTDYKNTEHYCVTKQFLNDSERMLEELLRAEL